jgi:drug/metabolite transporter (DMT)-like permease
MKKDPGAALPVSAIKLFMVACASLFFFELQPLFSGGVPSLPDFGPILASPVALSGVLYTGLITTALALFAESVAFRRVPATDASIILTMEPLFAAALAAVFVGETFGTSDYVGAALIIGACVLAVLNGTGEKGDVPVEDNSST